MRNHVLLVVSLGLLLCLLAVGSVVASPDTVTVDSATDVSDGDTSSIANLKATRGSDGLISLREAIEAANNTSGPDTIEFDIPASDPGYEVSGITGTWTISLTAALPSLSDGGTVISGTSQAANVGGDPNPQGPEIEVAGAGMTSGGGFSITSAGNVIHALVINRCPENGIQVSGASASENNISGNYIGTDAYGTEALGNGADGVHIRSGAQNNTIGGDTEGERNLISGNGQSGVDISGSGTSGNRVSGNYIGTDVGGTTDLGNEWHGIDVSSGAQGTLIGGDTDEERNLVSGNDIFGIRLLGSNTNSNNVRGNYIGTDAGGTKDLGNGANGVMVTAGAENNAIGPNNLIAYSGENGVYVYLENTLGNRITQNSIHSNAGLGIETKLGGNNELPPPENVSSSCSAIAGTAPADATVEVFTGPDEEGKVYVATADANGAGEWSVPGSFFLQRFVTATATDSDGNTSEFSVKVDSNCYFPVFLPLIVRNH